MEIWNILCIKIIDTSVDAAFSKYIKIQWTYFLADLCIRWNSNNGRLETFNCLSNNVMHQLNPEGQSSMENLHPVGNIKDIRHRTKTNKTKQHRKSEGEPMCYFL